MALRPVMDPPVMLTEEELWNAIVPREVVPPVPPPAAARMRSTHADPDQRWNLLRVVFHLM
jgi:hypothetical protein